jgi:hypothetical protein
MAMSVAVVVVVVLVLVVPISMAVAMIFVVPVAFVELPAFRVAVVVWMAPIRSREWRLLVMASNPTIVVSPGYPEALYPYHLGHGRRGWG